MKSLWYQYILGIVFVLFLNTNHLVFATDDTPYSFIRLDVSNGLANNHITCIFKDSKGFVWIGTSSGLSRYDGNNFLNYSHNDKDSASIPDNYITNIQEDKFGRLWIGTRKNYTLFDPRKEIFCNSVSKKWQKVGINLSIKKVYIDNRKTIWYMPKNMNRFFIYDSLKQKLFNPIKSGVPLNVGIVDFLHHENRYYAIYTNGILECFDDRNYKLLFKETFIYESLHPDKFNAEIFIDNEKDIWIYGNNDGIYYYHKALQRWSHISINSSEISLSSNLVRKIIQDDKGLIWVGTDHGGIDVINKFSKKVQTIYNQSEDYKSISQNSITDLFIDNESVIWIGTFKKGICYYHESIHKFPHIRSNLSDKNSLPFSDVNCFAEDKKGNLWIGTNGGGLIYFDRTNQTYKVYKNDPNNSNSLCNNVIVSLFIDNDDLLWIGTYTGGLNTFNGNTFTHYEAGKHSGLTNNSIWTISEDTKNRIWIGTLGGGIVLFDKKKGEFLTVPNQGDILLPSSFVNHIIRLHNGDMFIGTGVGIVFYDTEEDRYKYHPLKNSNTPVSLSNNNVNWVFEDSRNLLWIASREGLTLFDPYSNYLKKFRKEDGLSRDIMNCIQEDEYHSIWVSKSTGLSQIIIENPSPGSNYKFSIYHYTDADGLQGLEFNSNSSIKTRKGELIFGGPNGFNMFKTRDIKYNKKLPVVVFTDFQIFNKSVKPKEKVGSLVVLENSISYTDQITINHSMNVFSIQFAALNSFIPGKHKYKYQLEGFDKDWIEADGNEGKAIYTNLNAGSYTFKVKACNNDGLWNEQVSQLKITILPPFYLTTTAYIIYVLLLIAIFIYLRYNTLKKARFKFEMEQERLTAKRNHELDEMKLRFLTNVSHEFRTPLTLILAPLEKLLKSNWDKGEKRLLDTMHRNAKILLELVNQLLDFRKLDLHGLKYQASYGDLIAFMNEVCANFSDSFQRKEIQFGLKTTLEQFYLEFDTDKLKRVMMNLLSNSLKFTPNGGNVNVFIELLDKDGKEQIKIIVKDDGVGIAEEDKEKIFERFYQSQNNASLGITGSGIGLHLAKEMIMLHGGTISVKSQINAGSEFTVILPVKAPSQQSNNSIEEEIQDKEQSKSEESPVLRDEKPAILLIEDNPEFMTFMKDSLSGRFQVHIASNGSEGYDMVHKFIPDIIVSDVMMPQMDGLELCRRLKRDIRTCHIPLILLTARTTDEDKIKGLEIGADDYITKPFNMELLVLRIHALMEKRIEIQNRFKKHIDLSPSDIEIPSMDEKLIGKAISLVNKNIAEPEFSVEDLSKELGMSRVYLYKKLMAITGKSPVEFIRIIRLKRGMQLLEKSQMSVSEIAYAVGFNSPRYFSKYFKDEYGLLPKEYLNKKRKDNTDKIDI